MTRQFYTTTMLEKELGYPPRSLEKAFRNRPFPPAGCIGKITVYSQQQLDWLAQREREGRSILVTHPFVWRSPWDGCGVVEVFMKPSDVAGVLGCSEGRVRRMVGVTGLVPDAVAGRYVGFLPRSVAQWLGECFGELLVPGVLVELGRWGVEVD